MAFELEFEFDGQVACITAKGRATMENFANLFSVVQVRTQNTSFTRVIVDLRQTEGRPPFTDQFRPGEMVALRLSHLQRLASVVRPEYRTGTSEKVASAMGFELRVFTDLRAARTWVTE